MQIGQTAEQRNEWLDNLIQLDPFAPPYQPLSGSALFSALREIESIRTSKEMEGFISEDELNHAEANVLVCLAVARMERNAHVRLVEEWLRRAQVLDPKSPAVAQARLVWGYRSLLVDRSDASPFPVIRETDSAMTRKEQATLLLARLLDERMRIEQRAATLVTLQEAAAVYAQPQPLAVVQQLQELDRELLEKIDRLRAAVADYRESLQGHFYSSEQLREVQEQIRQWEQAEESRRALVQKQLPDRREAEPATALEELDTLIGMQEIKTRVRGLAGYLRYQQERREQGWSMSDEPVLHMILMGNPGTGKTTLARLLARLYHELGLLPSREVIEVDRSHLVGAFLGQTEQRTMEAIERAVGGVLFIDEAYSLKRPDSSGSDYGQVVIDTLVSAMTSGEYAGRFVVILAGYPEEMRHFLMANPGLRSRFPEQGHFLLPDYTVEELLQIADRVAERNDFTLTEEARAALGQRLERERVDASFGNARTCTNLVLDAMFQKGQQVMKKDAQLHSLDDYTLLDACDFQMNKNARESGDGSSGTLSALDKLAPLIGLREVKEEFARISSFLQIQALRREKGLVSVPAEFHAVFRGSPGTGKTSVAHLYAQLLREKGYLKRGHLVVAGRADLVAGYVGQTASLTKRKIREALGGVLFIDEAYALIGGSEQDFGREAVAVLVEEMSRHGENLVVVVAGYPDEMDRFLASNPGLASRFQKQFWFPDYTPGELREIMVARAKELGYRIDRNAEERLLSVLDKSNGDLHANGNARTARMFVEEAIQHQAVRLSSLTMDQLDENTLSLLVWEDFSKILDSRMNR